MNLHVFVFVRFVDGLTFLQDGTCLKSAHLRELIDQSFVTPFEEWKIFHETSSHRVQVVTETKSEQSSPSEQEVRSNIQEVRSNIQEVTSDQQEVMSDKQEVTSGQADTKLTQLLEEVNIEESSKEHALTGKPLDLTGKDLYGVSSEKYPFSTKLFDSADLTVWCT